MVSIEKASRWIHASNRNQLKSQIEMKAKTEFILPVDELLSEYMKSKYSAVDHWQTAISALHDITKTPKFGRADTANAIGEAGTNKH
jgi:hypothetical protein